MYLFNAYSKSSFLSDTIVASISMNMKVSFSIGQMVQKNANRIMNKYIILVLSALFLSYGTATLARDSVHQFSIAEVMEKPDNISKLAGVSFYFGDQNHPSFKQNYGEFRTNKKTNAFNKSDVEACQWVMMSALLQLHAQAREMGADAVINIKSNYKNNKVSSETDYTCGAGNVVAGVALVGEIVKLDSGTNYHVTTTTNSHVTSANRQVVDSGNPADSSGIREAQKRLTELGYSPGPADGIMGSRTSAALGIFQDSQGLPVTGTVNEQTLEALRNTASDQ